MTRIIPNPMHRTRRRHAIVTLLIWGVLMGLAGQAHATRIKDVAHATGVGWTSDEPVGPQLATAYGVIFFSRHPAALREVITAPVNSGGLEAVAVSLQEAEICSANLYSAIVCSA